MTSDNIYSSSDDERQVSNMSHKERYKLISYWTLKNVRRSKCLSCHTWIHSCAHILSWRWPAPAGWSTPAVGVRGWFCGFGHSPACQMQSCLSWGEGQQQRTEAQIRTGLHSPLIAPPVGGRNKYLLCLAQLVSQLLVCVQIPNRHLTNTQHTLHKLGISFLTEG